MTEPLTPPDCDLRGLEYMPLLGQHLFGSEFNARANDSEWRAALTLWWAAWCQVPAASLPDDDIALCRFADLGRDVKAWKKLRERALHGWIKCDDDRLYHPILAQQALLAWEKRQANRTERSSVAERKAREREERSRMFQQLAEIGVTPEWNIKTGDLRKLVTQHCVHQSQGHDEHVTQPVTPNVTAKTRRDETGRDNTIQLPDGNCANGEKPDLLKLESDKRFWDTAKAYIGPSKASMIGKWVRDYGKDDTAKAITSAQIERVVDPIPYIERTLRNGKARDEELPIC